MGSEQNEVIIGAVRKNSRQTIRVTVADYAERPFIYARVFDDPPSANDNHPGLTMGHETARGLLPLLAQAVDVAEMRAKARDDDASARGRRR